jgi:hypothetical protein
MTDLLEILKQLLVGCASSPAALATFHDQTIITDNPLPQRLEQFLTEYHAHPEYEAEADKVMSDVMRDFGARVFWRLLVAGLRRKEGDTDLAQNKSDVLSAEHLLKELQFECINTPFVPQGATDLLGRVANALHDVRWNNSRPALFDGLAPAMPFPDTVGIWCEGSLAAALEILIAGGLKLAAAKAWLEQEIQGAGLVDEAGNPIGAERVASWRGNFRKGIGAANARLSFDSVIEDHKALIAAPKDSRKSDACEAAARGLIRLLALTANRTVPPPQARDR